MAIQISRREFLRLAAVAGVGGVLAGCGVAPAPTAVPTATNPATQSTAVTVQPTALPKPTTPPLPKVKRGGQVIHADVRAIPGWDIHTSNFPGHPGQTPVFETLLKYELVDQEKVRWELRPGLAEKWEQPDPKTIVLYLRKGVKFHDGSDFNAEVAKWNIDRLRTDPKSFPRTQFAEIDTVEALDTSTIRIKLKSPNAVMLRLLSSAAGYARSMMSKVQFEKLGADGFALNPSGTGPMKLKSWKQDDRVILEPFKDYWQNGEDGKPLPYIDEFVSRYIPDLSTALVELQAGTLHTVTNFAPKDLVTVKANPNLVLMENAWSGIQYFTLGFKMTEKPFDNVKVRQAMLMSIDREGMNKVAGFGVAKPMYYPFWGIGELGYDETIPKNALDLDKAKQLLTEAGYPNGFETTLKSIGREPDNTCAQYQQQIWAKIGIKVQLQPQERLVWLDDMAALRFQTAIWRTGPFFDPSVSSSQVMSDGAINFSKFSDKEIDQLMTDGVQTTDEQKRHEIYRKVLTRIQEQAYVGAGILAPTTNANLKKLQGVILAFDWPEFNRCWLNG